MTPAGAGAELGSSTLDGQRVVHDGALAAELVALLASRHGRTEAEILALLAVEGWSNGVVMTVAD